MTTIPRRRFLQGGALGVGAGWLQGGGLRAQGSAGGASSSRRVRMMGDGLGLTPADQARLWTQTRTRPWAWTRTWA